MIEVDVRKAKEKKKNYNMGRYDHDAGWIASDRKTVYLSDDKSSGSVLFKFVADKAEDFSKGQLYAYQQSDDGMSGTWMPLSMDLNTMLHAREEAFKMGATVFMRLEWVEGISDDVVFITETGRGKAQNVSGALAAGGNLALHLAEMDANDGSIDSTFTDMYGRVLRLNTRTGKIESAIEGGGSIDVGYNATGNHLSSPDGLASTVINGRTYLVINEDLNPSGLPGSPAHFNNKLNEIYFLDVTGDHEGIQYNTSDLHRFVVGPSGCETTGGRFTPDGSTYFVNIQHPSTSNKAPFDHSVTVAITGYAPIFDQSDNSISSIEDIDGESGFDIYPNPATRELNLTAVKDIAIYNQQGKRIMVKRAVKTIDISTLEPGTYFIRDNEGNAKKLIVQ